MSDSQHKHYDILNLIGYGLAKFDLDFIRAFGFKTKTAFYQKMVSTGIGGTIGTIKNRQDLFDPFFENKRKGWWQKGNTYLHRKISIDSLFSDYDANQLAVVVKLYIEEKSGIPDKALTNISPILRSKFKQLQTTGREAELYFMHNFQTVDVFKQGSLEDARLLGDGYDFQVQIGARFVLVEVKGIRSTYGSLRLTKNEYLKAKLYQHDYSLVVVSSLDSQPKMTSIFNPVSALALKRQKTTYEQISYHTIPLTW
jgi:hypothetical protein